MQSDWTAFLPQLILALGGLAIFCAGCLWRNRFAGVLAAVALAASLGAGLAVWLTNPGGLPSYQGLLDRSGYASFFTLLFSGITALTLLFLHPYAKARGLAGDELYGLLLFAALGMTLVAGALHWVVFFLGLELLSLPLYVLIASRRDSPASIEAGLKYFTLGAVASALLAFGIAVLYAFTGTMSIPESLHPAAGGGNPPGVLLGIGLILTGVGFKLSLVPFHFWTPDVYQGAPAPVAAFLSTGSKAALFAALLRVALSASPPLWDALAPVLWVLAALGMVVGNVTALAQSRVKRLLAYSSVAQMGYLLMALLAVHQEGARAVLFYLTVFVLMDLGAFGSVGALSPESEDLDRLDDCRGLGYTRPFAAATLALCLFSLAGFPPFAGFVGKLVLFQATLKAGFVGLAAIGIVTAIVSVYVYLKVVVSLYMQPPETAPAVPGAPASARLAGALVIILLLALGLAPSALLEAAARVIDSLRTFV